MRLRSSIKFDYVESDDDDIPSTGIYEAEPSISLNDTRKLIWMIHDTIVENTDTTIIFIRNDIERKHLNRKERSARKKTKINHTLFRKSDGQDRISDNHDVMNTSTGRVSSAR